MKKRLLFIVNPIAGIRRNVDLPKLIEENINKEKFEITISLSQYMRHANELAAAGVRENYDAIIAAGGDGTINEVAAALVSSGIPLGIIPVGSGNGFARCLKIPMNIISSIQRINHFVIKNVDTCEINGRPFFNAAGIGFDALISSLFLNLKRRGLRSYLKLFFTNIGSYKAKKYAISIDNKYAIEESFFMIVFSNSDQYGNNVIIAPLANLRDGLIEVCMIKPFPIWKLPQLLTDLVRKRIHKSKYVTYIKAKNITVKGDNMLYHIDGEIPLPINQLEVDIKPLSLKVIAL